MDSVRGAYYGHKRVAGARRRAEHRDAAATARRSRKRETTTQDAVASAVATLRGAIDSIEFELEAARERADEATAEYEAMQAADGRPDRGDPGQDRGARSRGRRRVVATDASEPAATKPPARKEAAGS